MDKREQEIKVIYEMIHLYCRKKHHKKGLCKDCSELYAYAKSRVEKCPFVETKTFCSQCKVHCYKMNMRNKIRSVMKFSGPRMLFYHPQMTLKHLYYQMRNS